MSVNSVIGRNRQMRDLDELAARVEAAAGPDARLDCLIENALGLAKFERDPRVGYGDADYNRVDPKPFTASIDAALTLVPEGWFTRMALEDRHSHSWRWDLRGGFGQEAFGRGVTAPLAITIATLRARSAAGGEHG